MPLDQRRQFLDHVIMHLVMPRVRLLGGVEVEARALTEVPGTVRVVCNVSTARAGIRRHDDDAQLGRQSMGSGFLHEVFICAGQAGQPVQHRQLAALLRLWRQIDGKHHVATEHLRMVLVALVPAAEALLAGNIFQRHRVSSSCRPQASSCKRVPDHLLAA